MCVPTEDYGYTHPGKGKMIVMCVPTICTLSVHKPKHLNFAHMFFRFCVLPIGACCSDDLAAAHYQLAHAVPMVGLWPTTEPNPIFYWDYNQLKARSEWLHALSGCTL